MDLRAPFERPVVVAGLFQGPALALLQRYAHALPPPDLTGRPVRDPKSKWWRTFVDICEDEGPKARLTLLRTLVEARFFDFARAALGDDIAIVTEYCQFRRYDPVDALMPSHWHYDAILTSLNNRMLTFWVAVDDVDDRTPGLTIATAPEQPSTFWSRLTAAFDDPDRILSRDSRAATLMHDEEIAEALADRPDIELISPRLPAGGAIVFDGRFLHRTQMLSPTFDRPRYSLEIRVMAWNDLPTDILDVGYEIARARVDPDSGSVDLSIVTSRATSEDDQSTQS